MSREIKFRGKRLDNGEWEYGYLVRSEQTVDDKHAMCQIHVPFALAASVRMVNVDPETVGQYTGLRDKDGKEIYEGDIVKDGSHISRVGWNVKFASFVLDSIDWVFSHYFEEAVKPEDCEVLGNIHDTPELLGKEGQS